MSFAMGMLFSPEYSEYCHQTAVLRIISYLAHENPDFIYIV